MFYTVRMYEVFWECMQTHLFHLLLFLMNHNIQKTLETIL